MIFRPNFQVNMRVRLDQLKGYRRLLWNYEEHPEFEQDVYDPVDSSDDDDDMVG